MEQQTNREPRLRTRLVAPRPPTPTGTWNRFYHVRGYINPNPKAILRPRMEGYLELHRTLRSIVHDLINRLFAMNLIHPSAETFEAVKQAIKGKDCELEIALPQVTESVTLTLGYLDKISSVAKLLEAAKTPEAISETDLGQFMDALAFFAELNIGTMCRDRGFTLKINTEHKAKKPIVTTTQAMMLAFIDLLLQHAAETFEKQEEKPNLDVKIETADTSEGKTVLRITYNGSEKHFAAIGSAVSGSPLTQGSENLLEIAAAAQAIRGFGAINVQPGKVEIIFENATQRPEVITQATAVQQTLCQLNLRSKILVVDDTPKVLETLKTILAYSLEPGTPEPQFFENPRTALEAFKTAHEQGEQFGLVITDLNMPGLNGLQLIVAIRKIDPDVKIILHSSETRLTEIMPSEFRKTTGADLFIPKQIRAEAFVAMAVRLEQPQQPQ